MKNKKYHLGILSVIMSLTFLFGCNGEPPPQKNQEEQEKQPGDLHRGVQ